MSDFKRGLKSGIPIGLGYLSVSFTFGIIAITYGFTWWEALLISMTTVTSAGQFAGINIMRMPGYYISMLISQLTINVRYSFMSISLSQKLDDKFKGIKRWLLGFFMTDEIFAVAAGEKSVSVPFFTGLAVIPYIGWSLGTFLGAVLGNVLPDNVLNALSLAIYGMFVAIVVPDMKGKWNVTFVVIVAAVISILFTYVPYMNKVSSGIAISISAVVASVLGALVFPVPDEKEGESGGY